MNKNIWLGIFFYSLTLIGFLIIYGSMLFFINGNWQHLSSEEYYIQTLTTTSVAWFLRALWQLKGNTNGKTNDKVIKTERVKSSYIQDISAEQMMNELKSAIENEMLVLKSNAYRDKCDLKVSKLRYKLRKKSPFNLLFLRHSRLEFWEEQQSYINRYIKGEVVEEFNIENVKVKHYKVTYHQMSTVENNEFSNYSNTRWSPFKDYMGSLQINILTLVLSGLMYGLSLEWNGMQSDDWALLLAQTYILMLNIYNGYTLGIKGIKKGYMSDLMYDIQFLERFTKDKGIKIN